MLSWDSQDHERQVEEQGPYSDESPLLDEDVIMSMKREFVGPRTADIEHHLAVYEAMPGSDEIYPQALSGPEPIAFVHFDVSTAKNNVIEALIHRDDLASIDRGLYVKIDSHMDSRNYSGRIVEGPFFDPDVLKRDSTPVQFIILNQGQGKVLSLPEYHGRMQIEILGEEINGLLVPATRRPHPASPVFPYGSSMMVDMLNLNGNILLGRLDTYEDVFVNIDGDNKNVLPRNMLIVGTVGSGKSNTNQVLIEETLNAGYAQVVVDPEGEYTLMDQPVAQEGIEATLDLYERKPCGVKQMKVYRPPRCSSKREGAIEFSVPFDSLSPELIVEITDMIDNQARRFTFLYEQAIALLRKQARLTESIFGEDEADLSRGYPGITLELLLSMLRQEISHYEYKRIHGDQDRGRKTTKKPKDEPTPIEEPLPASELDFYCRQYQLKPLIEDYPDLSSYRGLLKKLRELHLTRLFDRTNAEELKMEMLSSPGQLSVLDMSDCDDRQVKNIIIADLLARMYRYKMELSEKTNKERKIIITLEEAHGFVSRENKDKMGQTLSQLQRIARRGRKRWLILHFVTQSPQHLPSELFELANNKIIHQTTGTENLRVLKLAAGTVNEGIWDDVPSLGIGRAIVVSSQYPHPIVVRFRPAASQRNYML
ncbi:ATP-binding protein [Dictyobacter arantiisoli]|uniref:Helicase HerA central domain-containing protein n=1 Tax=Dictyobacter arantiisoli TaxID=2014874 RepID=A0A5A5TK40_9CHLR|nr:ATP-binding protein [Dictyobacter arantiisoli]GCF11393.1 hypothetical protein KDI_49570 [Dictyobacter arantiisoli]